VLGFDNIAIAYGSEQKLSPTVLGVFRGTGAILGCVGVACYKFMGDRRYNIVLIGLIGLIFQNVFLNLTTVSIFLPGNQFDLQGYAKNVTFSSWFDTAYGSIFHVKNQTMESENGFSWMLHNSPSLLVFFVGLTLARFGLWMADPAIQQIMQETVLENERYRVNLAQNSMQEIFSFLKDLLVGVIAFPLVYTFGALIVTSVTFVFAGLVIYLSYFISEGYPIRRETEEAIVMRMELNVTERPVHSELDELLSNGDPEKESMRTESG
ncbi:hypothetical protein PRIPAC_75462, partial [Pristionchus pacificus]